MHYDELARDYMTRHPGDCSYVLMRWWQILWYMTSAASVGILVSLFTPQVSDEKLNRFYQLSRTPIGPDEKVEQPCSIPATTPCVDRRMLLTAGGLEIPMPSRASVIGFVSVWVVAGLIIGGFVWVVS